MPYIPYSPYQDAANTMSGVASGLGQVMMMTPQLAAQRAMMNRQAIEAQQQALLYQAQAGLAGAQQKKAEAETQKLNDQEHEDTQLGTSLASIMQKGTASPEDMRQMFIGLARKAHNNPDQLANAFSHMAATMSSGVMTNQPLAQAVMVGDRAYGRPVNLAPGHQLLGPDNQPVATNTNFPPHAVTRSATEQDLINQRNAAYKLYSANPALAGTSMFSNALAGIQGMAPLAGPTVGPNGTNAPRAVATNAITPLAAGGQVRVIGPNGETGSMKAGGYLPAGWQVLTPDTQ